MANPIYQVDAFTDEPFKGNPAAVCLLEAPADATWMQKVAAEMNLSETAFVRRRTDEDFELRWFTPAVEVELCGHATLATAHVLWESSVLSPDERARFRTRSGPLAADRVGGRIELDFPAAPSQAVETPDGLLDALGVKAAYVGKARADLLVELADAEAVRAAAPDVRRLRDLGVRGVMITARSDEEAYDFVSRFFAPGAGIDEDPVTGSAHCALAPYWADKLGKSDLVGFQASTRGGIVRCEVLGDRVRLAGHAVTILRGELFPS